MATICIFATQSYFSLNGSIILHNQLHSGVLHGVPHREGHREIHQERPRLAKDGGGQESPRKAILWRNGRGTGEGNVWN